MQIEKGLRKSKHIKEERKEEQNMQSANPTIRKKKDRCACVLM